MIGHPRYEDIAAAFEVLFADFAELFGAIRKAVEQDDYMLGLFSMIVKFGDANIMRQILVVFLLHCLDANNSLLIVGSWLRMRVKRATVKWPNCQRKEQNQDYEGDDPPDHI